MKKKIDQVFLGANVLFSAAYSKKNGLQQLWKLPEANLLSSEYVVEEALRNLSLLEQKRRFEKLILSIKVVSVDYHRPSLPRDIKLVEKDRPVLAAAVNAKSTHLLTGDFKDFGVFYGKTISGVLILPPAKYLKAHP